ncbi:MAG: hypothetical protein VX603_15065 [Gemmatimonadota bacterium]|nr:hypothetical protein [Gemmatimonadota bacterium]
MKRRRSLRVQTVVIDGLKPRRTANQNRLRGRGDRYTSRYGHHRRRNKIGPHATDTQ